MPRSVEMNICYIIYSITVFAMTTIAVKESTAERLKRLMKAKHAESLDQTINALIEDAQGVPKSMFGADKSLRMRLTLAEHEEFQR